MTALLLSLILWHEPEVKFCKNLQTGKVVVVQKGYPCPFPTIEV